MAAILPANYRISEIMIFVIKRIANIYPSGMVENSKAKLEKKHLDMVVANNLKQAGAGFGTDTNVVTLITKDICFLLFYFLF